MITETSEHPAISAWALNKFKDIIEEGHTEARLALEKSSSGYCETCYHESEDWIVQSRAPGGEWKYVTTTYDDLGSLMRQILDFKESDNG